jgi:hypothetical protein
MHTSEQFTFEISLSVLNHLGRNLYRSFVTVLGEAISNSWDANADNVWIYIDDKKNSFFIKDDGDGMNSEDFQNKFLKIGYTKRNEGNFSVNKRRPFIGRKGIGKLALLSCAKKISIISKTAGMIKYIGGTINNSGLDEAIKRDLTPDKYPLEEANLKIFDKYTKKHKQGTIIYFEKMDEGIRHDLTYLRKIIALYFRFSLIDKSFKIFLNDKKITLEDLRDLADQTEFLWDINGLKDPFIKKNLRFDKKNLKNDTNLMEPAKRVKMEGNVKGFIASVRLPRYLKIRETDEKLGVDLFVNGRLRERNILRHIPTARLVENYIYGQIHYNDLDDNEDRFATGREGIVADDDKFKELLEKLKKTFGSIIHDWDVWRRKHRKSGDPDNETIPEKERKAEELYNVVSEEFEIKEGKKRSKKTEKIDEWIDNLTADARYNFPSYAICFICENLIRKHINYKKIRLSKEAKTQIKKMKRRERDSKNLGNVSIKIRKESGNLSYLSMDDLANLVDKPKNHVKDACLVRDANAYKPIRDALMHTALLSEQAKHKLDTIHDNIKGRVKTLLSK